VGTLRHSPLAALASPLFGGRGGGGGGGGGDRRR
jgi:hypothetical protein